MVYMGDNRNISDIITGCFHKFPHFCAPGAPKKRKPNFQLY